MMSRFGAYIEKVFHFSEHVATVTDSRKEPIIPAASVFQMAFYMFATARGSLNAIDKDRHFPGRLRRLVGPRVPSADTVGRVYACMDGDTLRQMLVAILHRVKRNKMLSSSGQWLFAAIDGHEFFRQSQTLLRVLPDAHHPGSGP
jgi:hypothetical protein